MHVKVPLAAAMNDLGAQQPSQMFLTWVKVRPQHRELRALLLTNSVWVPKCPTVICNKGCETGSPAYSPYPRIPPPISKQLFNIEKQKSNSANKLSVICSSI